MCGGLVFLFFVAPFSLLAVFGYASAFNQDVSNWNTGAVTTMEGSKSVVSLNVTTNRGSSNTILIVTFFCCIETVPLLLLLLVVLSVCLSVLYPLV